ncbi:ZIP family metal transporter [Clostridium sporogenes]|uniref:ZIP family metal transporter n=2 Tax=Clostridium TaxID=1485 RepID=A0A6M0T1Q8_CLOBO|nr:ZIP family metal transporter [Clostridium sporogenes]NFA60712.1 ZIP family metal transporter [Clostridium botulinum]MDS1003159.1 ZIP family metal transporter [Clostridium sporogenes]NFI74162.1 ZIP family metal transporter [Clostridium sporogenes]NFL71876.1 ZIP family metal transporter [Clostridium sporogenes]NFM23944.1 ZIP family metal transporter [Clostridium sporogenes]
MSEFLFIIVMGTIVSLAGTMIGAAIGVSLKNPSERLLSKLMGFSAGLMISIVIFDLIPEALNTWDYFGVLIFLLLGVLIVYFIDKNTNSIDINMHKKVAFMTALGLILHNFPEGILMGVGFQAGSRLGLKMAIIISIHDIPEGIAVATPLIASKEKKSKTLFYVFLTAVPTLFGVFLGFYIANISKNFLSMLLSLASGIMIYVVCAEMIPESRNLGNKITSYFYMIVGIIAGLVIIKLL